MGDEVEKAIEESAKGPKRASGDSGCVEQHSLREQIEVDRYPAVKGAGIPSRGCRRRGAPQHPPAFKSSASDAGGGGGA